ncbi:nitroimidazol reductase NimA-like FMN-containing flavoprotein (pyridoxamine 5'-phosphate oxidase superfamily) [Saccharothrix tamanrassetensis]|uniref:Nitroimidazol reductase NimA-like FMN-containing flavoprotein (Pyridoxamine 5'-phosphate oxidase superfamily) n=1 Tax=Saccharothrix tamanrassetensis TaxID=1051531 RepID=A0A841CGM6_9PSEU|nr:pyridoxamine 5'-phosphate oxidase family protein [Saccharothrix tamanrassetensis]MBB5955328.1 nitroimidazol reductase NimA-like FMN-containing flavoprotein (pyridoxamine 5'-phosphate oxidase superfamily) [Saccharothrix tamanrassetensis]
MYDSAGLQVLSREECLHLLGTMAVGRLVFTDKALPVVHPVVYVLDGESVVLRVPDGSLALVARDTIVAFQIDDVEPDLSKGWSVMAVGHVTEAVDEPVLSRLRQLPLASRGMAGEDHFLLVALEVLSGRRIP